MAALLELQMDSFCTRLQSVSSKCVFKGVLMVYGWWQVLNKVIAGLENNAKTLTTVCSEKNGGTLFKVCSTWCWVSAIWWNVVTFLWSNCVFHAALQRPDPAAASGSPLMAFFFLLRKKSFSLLTRGGFLSLLCEGGLASCAQALCAGHALLSTLMWHSAFSL